jgi:hypothetical protein
MMKKRDEIMEWLSHIDWTLIDEPKATLILEEARLYVAETLETQKIHSTRTTLLIGFISTTITALVGILVNELRKNGAVDVLAISSIIPALLGLCFAAHQCYELMQLKDQYTIGCEPKTLLNTPMCREDIHRIITGIAINYQEKADANNATNEETAKLLQNAVAACFAAPISAAIVALLFFAFGF